MKKMKTRLSFLFVVAITLLDVARATGMQGFLSSASTGSTTSNEEQGSSTPAVDQHEQAGGTEDAIKTGAPAPAVEL
ncbi:unnamed protein product, partial [Amoebophrya sp. A25]|eukprot:GSA25T00019680001.1